MPTPPRARAGAPAVGSPPTGGSPAGRRASAVATPVPVLSERALGRAVLSRQLLLERSAMGAEQAVHHLYGIHAQSPSAPYHGLHARLDGFAPQALSDLLAGRRVVRMALMRGTLHLVTAEDCGDLRPLVAPVLRRALATAAGRGTDPADLAVAAAAGRALVERAPLTYAEIGAELHRRFPQWTPRVLSLAVRALVPLVQVPPRGLWGASGRAAHTSAEHWLGGAPWPEAGSRAGLSRMVCRYLAAYGPASVRDLQAWSGLTGLAEVVAELRPRLRLFHGDDGRELFDLSDAPRPDPEAPAPVRLLGDFEGMLVGYADRRRIMDAQHQAPVFGANAIIRATVLVDGRVCGRWSLQRERGGRAGVLVEPFRALDDAEGCEVEAEAARVLRFAAPEAAHTGVRFEPLAG